nr:MAG TPA: hypothetical protein [Caudoviricetes sp.]
MSFVPCRDTYNSLWFCYQSPVLRCDITIKMFFNGC